MTDDIIKPEKKPVTVMDIQPPGNSITPSQPERQTDALVDTTNVQPTTTSIEVKSEDVAPAAPAAESVSEAVDFNPEVAPEEPAPVSTESVSDSAVQSERHTEPEASAGEAPVVQTETQEKPVLAATPAPKKHNRTPLLAVILAVVIAGVFAVFTIMAYRSNDTDTAAPAGSSESQKQDDSEVLRQETSELKALVDEIATQEEPAEFNANDVNDAALGL